MEEAVNVRPYADWPSDSGGAGASVDPSLHGGLCIKSYAGQFCVIAANLYCDQMCRIRLIIFIISLSITIAQS